MFILLATQVYFISYKKLVCFPLGHRCWIQDIIDYLLYTIYISTCIRNIWLEFRLVKYYYLGSLKK